MCKVHDDQPELARLSRLWKSKTEGFLVPPTRSCVIDAAREIAGPAANAEILNLAGHLAEQLDHLRALCPPSIPIRALADPDYDTQANKQKTRAVPLRLLRKDILMAAGFLESVEGNEPGGRAAQIRNKLSRGEAKYLEAIDRYEPASVVRRKFATQAFDAARR